MTVEAAVFDCMVFVQAVASKGTAYHCLQRVITSEARLLISHETIEELRSVLERPELQAKLPGITPERVNALLHHLVELAVLIHPVEARMAFPPDPKDEPYLNLAVQGGATCLVTRDRALLRLANRSDSLSYLLLNIHPSLQVIVPEEFIETDLNLKSRQIFS